MELQKAYLAILFLVKYGGKWRKVSTVHSKSFFPAFLQSWAYWIGEGTSPNTGFREEQRRKILDALWNEYQ